MRNLKLKIRILLGGILLLVGFYSINLKAVYTVVIANTSGLPASGWTVYSNSYDKNTYTTMQYHNTDTYTTLTNPCTDCKIGTKLMENLSGTFVATGTDNITQRGQVKDFSGGDCSIPGEYKIKQHRYDSTLLKTYTFGIWYINSRYAS